jgi:hypothetical protein
MRAKERIDSGELVRERKHGERVGDCPVEAMDKRPFFISFYCFAGRSKMARSNFDACLQ